MRKFKMTNGCRMSYTQLLMSEHQIRKSRVGWWESMSKYAWQGRSPAAAVPVTGEAEGGGGVEGRGGAVEKGGWGDSRGRESLPGPPFPFIWGGGPWIQARGGRKEA